MRTWLVVWLEPSEGMQQMSIDASDIYTAMNVFATQHPNRLTLIKAVLEVRE